MNIQFKKEEKVEKELGLVRMEDVTLASFGALLKTADQNVLRSGTILSRRQDILYISSSVVYFEFST